MQQIVVALITGLTAGGISCLAVQGGLLTSVIAQETQQTKKRLITASFLAAKIISYTLLGFMLGAFGNALQITPTLQGWMQIFAGVYMLAVAANLLNLHPIFRYTIIQPPKWAYKFIKKESRRELVGPIILGILTILIPCGITQGMMITAIASGNALLGAGILFAFTLGTSPIFFVLGLASGELMRKKAFTFAASALIAFLGITSINTGQILRGSSQNFSNYWKVIAGRKATQEQKLAATDNKGVQNVTITATSSGYITSVNTLKVGVPVNLKLISKGAAGCVQVFTIPSLNIKKLIPQTGEEEIAFTPSKTGRLSFSCAMGMYTGEFQVI